MSERSVGVVRARAPAGFGPGTLGASAMLLLAWAVGLVVYPAEELGLDGHLAAGPALLPIDRTLAFLARDVHPPLYYLALKAWLGPVGPAFAVARWSSLAGGVLALVYLWLPCPSGVVMSRARPAIVARGSAA